MNDFTSFFDEVNGFHPLVADWLTDNGYEYQHHFDLPDYGTVDFLAWKDSAQLLIECKIKRSDIRSGIVQLAAYGVQLPEAKLAFAIPVDLMTAEHFAMAEKYGVMVIEIEAKKEKRGKSNETGESVSSLEGEVFSTDPLIERYCRVAKFDDRFRITPAPLLQEILDYHSIRGTCPLLDLVIAATIAAQSSPEMWSQSQVDNAFDIFLSKINEFAMSDDPTISVIGSCAFNLLLASRTSCVLVGVTGGQVKDVVPKESNTWTGNALFPNSFINLFHSIGDYLTVNLDAEYEE